MSRGFSRVYDLALAFELRRAWALQQALFGGPEERRWDLAAAARGRTIRDYDKALTMHTFGEPAQGCALVHCHCGWLCSLSACLTSPICMVTDWTHWQSRDL